MTAAASKWTRVSAHNPCPICKRTNWCTVATDGTAARCMHIEAGSHKTKSDKNGGTYFLHRLDGSARAAPAPEPRPPGPGTKRAEADQLHRAYSALLARLTLSRAHREALLRRGLTDEEIDRRSFRTLPLTGRARLAGALREQLGEMLLSVPGFVVKPGDAGRTYVSLAGAPGLLVPVCDAAGRIVALQSRSDDPRDPKRRYSYLSSAKHNGPGPGTPAHVPLGRPSPCLVCRLTEGALKADVASALSDLLTVGAAGATNWRPALDALQALGYKTVRLAFDADAWDNPTVARALAACSEAAAALGLAVELERWNKDDGKGIDDLLAGGKVPELLAGDGARAAIAEALAAATGGQPPAALDELDRLDALLADGGALAVLADRSLMDSMARLSEANPVAYARRCLTLKAAGLSRRDLDAALKPYLRDVARDRAPLLLAAGGYRTVAGSYVLRRETRDGPVEVPLGNFTGRIDEVVTQVDGAEEKTWYIVTGKLNNGRELPPVKVIEAEYDAMGWITPAWHGEAVVYAGQGTRDHLRAAIQLNSPDRRRRIIYAHTGWREFGGKWGYLHAGGVIGPGVPAPDVEVELGSPLDRFVLPGDPRRGKRLEGTQSRAEPSGTCWKGCVPTDWHSRYWGLSTVRRWAISPTSSTSRCSWLVGMGFTRASWRRGWRNTSALAWSARNCPATGSQRATPLEQLCFHAKDAVFVVDDYSPQTNPAKRLQLEALADRLLRSQGNGSGRERCQRYGGDLRQAYHPRGLILSTGEDVPPGQSLRGRMLVMEVTKGAVSLPYLDACQEAGAAGLYAGALAGFLAWLAPQYGSLAPRLRGDRAGLRNRAQTGAGSSRTPGIVADLALGLQVFFDFAVSAGALTPADREELTRRGWQAKLTGGQPQAAGGTLSGGSPNQARLFVRMLEARDRDGPPMSRVRTAASRATVPKPGGGPDERPSWV